MPWDDSPDYGGPAFKLWPWGLAGFLFFLAVLVYRLI